MKIQYNKKGPKLCYVCLRHSPCELQFWIMNNIYIPLKAETLWLLRTWNDCACYFCHAFACQISLYPFAGSCMYTMSSTGYIQLKALGANSCGCLCSQAEVWKNLMRWSKAWTQTLLNLRLKSKCFSCKTQCYGIFPTR